MRIGITTDMEGVAGVNTFDAWTMPGGYFYEIGKELLTDEVNAAVRGFLENGFDEAIIFDAHGHGGVDIRKLDERVLYQRGFAGPYPVGITPECDALAWVGQHAKAGTSCAHLAHTSSVYVRDQRINGVSVGEFGMGVYMAATMDPAPVPIFGSGDEAFCKEAKALCPHIHTVCVKRGQIPGSGDECTGPEYRVRNEAAVHISPKLACKKIYEEACAAAQDFMKRPDKFRIAPLPAPYTVEIDYRTDYHGEVVHKVYRHESDLIAAMNLTWADPDRKQTEKAKLKDN